MPWGAVAGATISYEGAQKAAGAQSKSAKKAAELERAQWDQTQRNEAPYLAGGQAAQNALTGWLGLRPDGSINPNAPGLHSFTAADFQNDPGFQFREKEGQEALLNQRSALGGQFSGATLKQLNDYAQGSASDEFNQAYQRFRMNQGDIYGRLAGQAGQGAQVAAGLGNLGQGVAGQMGQDLIGAGNAQAAGTVGGINAINQGLGQAYNMWQQNQILNKRPPAPTNSYGNNNYGGGYSLNLIGDAANDPTANWYTPSYFANNR